MKIIEVIQPQELRVERDTGNELHLKDPKTGVKTIVPRDPKKPGAVTTNAQGELEVDLDHTGPVDNRARPGSIVRVKSQAGQPAQPGQQSAQNQSQSTIKPRVPQ